MSENNETLMMAKEASGAVALRSSAPTAAEVTLSTVRGLLATYEKEMDINRHVSLETGVSQQLALMRAIKMVLRMKPEDFGLGWEMLLEFARRHQKGLMSMNYRNRFLDFAKSMSSRDRKLFQVLVHLIASSADHASRQLMVNRYDFGRLQKMLDNDESAALIEGFYRH